MLVNQILIVGRLGRDPELNYSPSGKAVTKFSIAVDHNFRRDTEGNRHKDTMWLNVACWDRLGERVAEQFRKGAEVFVQGRLSIRSYQDKQGQKQQFIEIVATSAQKTQYEGSALTSPSSDDSLGETDDHPF